MAVLWALLGLLVVGPFLGLLIYRLPRLEKVSAPLECPHCHVSRPFYFQSTLLSYLLGPRGRCRGCGAAPDLSGMMVEVATGLSFWMVFYHYGATLPMLLYSFYSAFLIVVFFIDWQHRLILNRMTYPGVLLALALTSLITPLSINQVLVGIAVGGGAFGLLYAVGYLVYRQEVLGLGDVKLAMVLGAMTGFPGVMTALLLASFIGALAALVFLASRQRSGRDFMPYGTAMCVGAFATFFVQYPFPLPF